MLRWTGAAVVAALIMISHGAGQGLKTPPDWKWVPDSPAKVVETAGATADSIFFVAMPPGWHITQGPGSVFYQPEYQARGNFAIEAEIFLFPDSSAEEYGLFAGGRSLEPGRALYTAFVARRDGHTAVLERKAAGVVPIANWTPNSSVAPSRGPDPVKNVLRVDATAGDVIFSVNGTIVTTQPRGSLVVDGPFGLRIGKGVNVHVSRLDVTHRLAPAK
jgi:hypothetical protein